MTTLAELVAQDPDASHGFPVDLEYGGGGFRAVVQIADPDVGAAVVWHDISDRISDIRWRFGASQPRGNQEAGSSTLMLWTTDDAYAPWNEDTSDLFGVHVPLNAGLLIRFGVFRVSDFGTQWFPQFTHIVRRWGDASRAVGRVRFHKIEAVDLSTTLANKPVGATIEQGHIARLAVLLETWPFGYEAYGVDTTDGTTPALTFPARAAQSSRLAELRLAARNAGLVVRSLKNGKLILHPAPRDTWNATQRALPGATGATWSNPLFTYYFDGVHFTYEPVFSSDIAFWPEMAGSSFGIESDWEHVVNEFTVSTPSGLYSFDDPVSASKFSDRSLPRETWLTANDQAVDDIVAERAYTQFVATPLRIGRELAGGFPALAILDHLDPAEIVYTTRIGRTVVTAMGQIRSIDHEFKALGGTPSTRQVRWRAAVQIDIDDRSTSSPLLPVEDLAVSSIDEDSAVFSWTNPTQVVTPTITQIRIAETNEWTDIAYPTTSITWLGLRPATDYRFEVRLLREVDGVVEAVSPARSVSFRTAVGVDGDGDGVIFDPPDPGCTVDVKLESSPDGTTWTVEATYTNVSYTTDGDGVSTYTPPPFSYDDDTLYRWCVRQVCGGTPSAWVCGAVFIGTCLDPSILATAPYDDAVAFVPKVCGLEVREAISETVGTTGTAFGGYGLDDIGNKALKSAAEGTVAYGLAEQLDDVRTTDGTIGIRVKLGAQPSALMLLFQAAGLGLRAAANGAGWSVSGEVLRDDGGTTAINDTTVLALNTWYDLKLAHDVTTGELSLRVDDAQVQTATYVGGRRMFLPGWTVRLPNSSIASNGAVWNTVLGLPTASLLDTLIAKSAFHIWRLNETSGSGAVDAIGGVNGTYAGGISLAAVAAPDGSSYPNFDGADDRVAVSNIGGAQLTSARTLFVIMKADTMAVDRLIMTKIASGAVEWGLEVRATGQLVLVALNSTGSAVCRAIFTNNSAVAPGSWFVAAFKIDGAISPTQTGAININGSWVTTNYFTNGVGYTATTAPFWIGWRSDTLATPFDGALAYAALLPGLTTTDIDEIMTAAAAEGWF